MTRTIILTSAVLLSTALVLLPATGFAGERIKGSDVAKTETREVGDFTKVQIMNSAKINVTIGPKAALTVETDDNILPIFLTEVRDGTLVLTNQKDTSFNTNLGVTVTVTVPTLEAVQILGSGDVTVNGLAAEKFSVDVRGSGDVKLSGKANALNVSVAGAGDVDATALTAVAANVAIKGSGDVKVHAEDALNASIAGSGDIRYAGNPKNVTREIRGQGNIRPM